MTVDEKIKESEFFLQKIEEYYYVTQDVDYYLSAFLCSTRSIPDHLLQEYNQKFGFAIPLEENDFGKIFRTKVKDNPLTERFMSLYNSKINAINKDEIGRFMWQKRNINIHRSNQTFDMINFGFTDTISDFAVVGEFDPNTPEEQIQKEMNRLREEKQKEQKRIESKTEVSLCFEVSGKLVEVKDACDKFLSLMKNMVSEIRTTFP